MIRLPSLAALFGAAVLVATVAAPPALRAQAPASAQLPSVTRIALPAPVASAAATDSAAVRATGPIASQAAFPSTLRAAPAAPAAAAYQNDARLGMGRNLAIIGVGAAAIAAGQFVEGGLGTGIAIGGGLLALYGLYQFLR